LANFEGTLDVQVTDVNGDSALVKVRVVVPDTTTLASLAASTSNLGAALAACTNGKVTSQGISFGFVKAQISAGTAPPPANATYPSVTDGARLFFSNSAGEKRGITIPAPLLTDFKAGSNTVNPADANIAAFITNVETDPLFTGTANLYEGGVKVAHHARKRAARKSL